MSDPLAFPFDDPANEHQTSAQRDARFVAAHPTARYVVLRIDDPRQVGHLIADLQEWPDDDLLTPIMENHVHAVAVAVFDEWPPA